MADTMQFDLVSPERLLTSVQAREVRIPGAEGDMTAMPDHGPLITTLRPGILTVVAADGSSDFLVTGGFAEISAEGVSVLAEGAFPTGDVTGEMVAEMVATARASHESATPDRIDATAKTLADMVAVGAQLGH
ncbi:MAG: F0F1 ATP synthase subunit epsilon [Paracoccaceae bacterium]|jgi:F-type H+-transporting ATPase subunit epsilon|nr:F0F1 ATP synthase subunit epsilon [Paracoccaceae bacterium]MDH5528410.1 F0F1 ATP synthase subunit epsilon [Paracoccaceae bacterium]